jgi:hypothetical protein
MKLAVWVAACKTPGCHANHPAKVIAEHEGQRDYPLPDQLPDSFDFECPGCNKKHRYTRADLHVVLQPFPPPAGFPEWW